MAPGGRSPAPWINVVANPGFGFQVAVEGSGYTWSLGSRENQLTPWSNDPVTDRPGEALYVRDEDSGALWGPTALPIRHEAAPYVARHGQGYSRFEHTAHGIALDLLQFVPLEDPIKISRLTIRNLSARTRRLSVTAYVEWVLGPSRSASALSVVTEIDPETGAMFARNPWNTTFGARVAFADLGGRQTAWTGDRREFLGRNGTLDNPAALAGDTALSQRVGAGLDPCGALQAPVELKPGRTVEIVFLLGEAATAADAQALIARYRVADLDAVLREVVAHWDDVLGTVQVKTPDRSMDLMLNRWLLYQTLACRVWARVGVLPGERRVRFPRPAPGRHGARAVATGADARASPARRGPPVRRRRCPALVAAAVRTGRAHPDLRRSGLARLCRRALRRDRPATLAVLDEPVPFLEGQALRPGEHDAYFQPMVADESARSSSTARAGSIRVSAVGAHGLPLIGTGDWNDGMNRVGEHGKGESVWLGWFLHATLTAFAPLAKARGEEARGRSGSRTRPHCEPRSSKTAGTATGTGAATSTTARRSVRPRARNAGSTRSRNRGACSRGRREPTRAVRAMAAMDEQLIRRDEGLALLFTPPFDRTPLDPGYIKGYPPGIRENGGQYTHAADLVGDRLRALGNGDKARAILRC